MGRAWVAAVMVLGACGRFGFGWGDDQRVDAAIDVSEDAAPDAFVYRTSAVQFDSSANDYMWRGSLANTTNSNRGVFSVWLRFNARDGQQHLIAVAQVLLLGGIYKATDDRLRFHLFTCAGLALLDLQSQNPITTASGWVHVLAAWDLAAGKAQLYINDVVDRAPNPGILNGNVCYDSVKWGIGGLNNGSLDADVADFYADLGGYIDIDVEANRRLFRDAAGKPVDLGPTCANPTQAASTGCFVGDAATWNMNKGTAGVFTLEGNGLVAAPSPSD